MSKFSILIRKLYVNLPGVDLVKETFNAVDRCVDEPLTAGPLDGTDYRYSSPQKQVNSSFIPHSTYIITITGRIKYSLKIIRRDTTAKLSAETPQQDYPQRHHSKIIHRATAANSIRRVIVTNLFTDTTAKLFTEIP